MDETKDAAVGRLEAEKQVLLDELELAYTHLEEILNARNYETNITYRELRKKNIELEQRLMDLQQAHQQLRQTQHMLVRSERMSAMGQMAAAIVHEINNPLTVLSGRLQLLLMKEGLAYRDELVHMHKATDDLIGMTRNILRFARQKSNGQVDIAPVVVNRLVEGVLDFFSPLLKTVKIETLLAPDLPQVLGDAAQIEQVLTNFIVNAADAMSSNPNAGLRVATGQGRLSDMLSEEQQRGRQTRLAINARDGELDRLSAYITVEDNGHGIDNETLEQIFEAFFTTKDEDKGTGLGLAICRSIAQSLGGNILTASRPGAGTGFRLLLPVDALPGAKE